MVLFRSLVIMVGIIFLIPPKLPADTIPVNKYLYSLVSVSSDNTNHPAADAFDMDTTTWWALYNSGGYSLPGEMIIDLGDTLDVSGFSYLPNSKSPKAKADSFAFFVSMDPGRWSDPELAGIFDWQGQTDTKRRTFFFGPAKGRYVKIMYLTNTDPASDNVHTCDLVVYRSAYPVTAYKKNQQISFSYIPEQFTRDHYLKLQAFSSSGLPVYYQVISGPVTLSHDTVFFTGQAGIAKILAWVEGNDTLYPRQVTRTFAVTDLNAFYPVIYTNLSEDRPVRMPSLAGYPLWFRTSIDYGDQLQITGFDITVDGEAQDVFIKDHTAVVNWTPDSYGVHTVHVAVSASNGNTAGKDYIITVSQDIDSTTIRGLDHILINFPNPGQVARDTMHLPQFTGGYNKLTGHFFVSCPDIPGGCDDWDRGASLEVLAPNGQWVGIIRYITPYGVACGHTIDLTDYMSILQGDVPYRLTIDTWGTGGWLVTLDLEYGKGTPDYLYSTVDVLWNKTFPFGDPANLQPVPPSRIDIHDYAEKAVMNVVTTGHGWGENNSQNAAEFYHAINYFEINGVRMFTQDLWQTCNPNPDNCTGQKGTWYYDRAGWCPGSIAKLYRYDLSGYISRDTITINYIFDPSYEDKCNPHNPDCISGTTCPNCKDGFNPVFYVSANLIAFSNRMITEVHSPKNNPLPVNDFAFEVWPNPVKDLLHFYCEEVFDDATLSLIDAFGHILAEYHFGRNASLAAFRLDVSKLPAGIYYIGIRTPDRYGLQKIIKL